MTTEVDLTHVPFFARLGPPALARLRAACLARTTRAGTVIFAEGTPCAGLVVVAAGLVRLYRVNSEGRLHTLALLRPPSAFNEVAAVDGGPNPFAAAAVTDGALLVVPRPRLMQLMREEPTLMEGVVLALAMRNRETLERLEDMTFSSIPSRLAKLFLSESAYAAQICEAPSSLTQEEMAAILGTTREVVGRALRALLNAGLLRKDGRQLSVADRDGLITLAHTNAMPSVPPQRQPR